MRNVLIVDDSAFMRNYIKSIVTAAGCEVIAEASNGVQAIELCRMHKPDLMTMDVTMTEMDGITTVKEIRRFNQNVKIVMVSAMGQQSIIQDALSVGANDFVVKPFAKEKLEEVIVNQLSRFMDRSNVS